MRDHEPIVIDKFGGLWQRGDRTTCPPDHFSEALNLKALDDSVKTRDGIGISQDVVAPLSNVRRIYNYPTLTGNTQIVLTYDIPTLTGSIHHVVDSTTVHGPLLSLVGMEDFAFLPINGRAYISPIHIYNVGGLNTPKGLQNEFLYVYAGDGTAARKAAGNPLTGALTIVNGAAGHTDAGFHLFAFVAETLSGYLTAPGAITGFTTAAAFSVSFSTVPTSGSGFVTKRHLVATKVINNYNGDTTGYTFYFVPNATINNDSGTTLSNISFFDADLLDDASHLLDNYTQIPAGNALCNYHNRLCLFGTFTDISLGLVSAVGEPEAISQIDGLIIMPPDGNPITNGAELRDVLYTFKRSKTGSFVDNGDEPSTWPYTLIDPALGCSIHGIATVLDSGNSNIDFLIIGTFQGITLFNGRYIVPELTWKMEDGWIALDQNLFHRIQIVNAPIQKLILATLPNKWLLAGNYTKGMDPKNMKWYPWFYNMGVNTIAIVNVKEIILGADYIA